MTKIQCRANDCVRWVDDDVIGSCARSFIDIDKNGFCMDYEKQEEPEECLEAIDQLPAVPARRARADQEIEKAIEKHEKHLELIRTVPDLKLARQFDSAVIKALKWVLGENNRLIAEKEVKQDGKKDS